MGKSIGTGAKVAATRERARKRPTEQYFPYSDRGSADESREAADMHSPEPENSPEPEKQP
jgi:hypothetical protein